VHARCAWRRGEREEVANRAWAVAERALHRIRRGGAVRRERHGGIALGTRETSRGQVPRSRGAALLVVADRGRQGTRLARVRAAARRFEAHGVSLGASVGLPEPRAASGCGHPRERPQSIRTEDAPSAPAVDARAMNITALETSFDAVAVRGDELVDDFYTRLFATAPSVRPLFSHDMRRQKAMLLSALVQVRKSLRNLDALLPSLRALGARHVAYGARPEHYPVVAATLVASMAAIAGDAWTKEYENAWAAALGVIADVMIAGAEEAESSQFAV
jgi:hemoglobin-like flavoprotein